MKRRLQPFSMGSSSNILAKGLLPSMAETFIRTHGWSILLKYTVPFSSMGNTLEFVDDEENEGGRPLKPISISNKNLHLLPFLKDQNISSEGLLPSMAETFRIHDWSLLLKHTNPFSSMGNTPEFVDDQDKVGGRPLKPISIPDKDLQLPSFFKDWPISSELKRLLPCIAETFKTKDWSLLRKFSSLDSNLNIEDALKSELAAICVCFLFTEVPPHVKGVARTLTFISLGTSKVPKMSTDQTSEENLVVRILSSGNTEAQRQVCLALSVLASCRSRRLAGVGIQDQLLQLVCNLSCNPDLTYPVLSAVASVSPVGKGMREKIFETELLDSWLVKLLSRKDDKSIMADAFWTVACVARERCDCEFWDHVKEKLLPPIVDGLYYTKHSVHMLGAVACAILNITKYVENMLRAGEAKAKAGKEEDEAENEYAKMIDGYSLGWDILFRNMSKAYMPSIARKAEDLLLKYRPISE